MWDNGSQPVGRDDGQRSGRDWRGVCEGVQSRLWTALSRSTFGTKVWYHEILILDRSLCFVEEAGSLDLGGLLNGMKEWREGGSWFQKCTGGKLDGTCG